ncbi:hypothetical protein DPMN_123346 [Dreissena polymorpha]|uniref:Uncharacterized protein n=1 Tax=Dreissena polymorpha TaxID=45954 RepID=A0A9D4GX95_DREPO|nr:hypothetical protein DPMN_123346 [Dreissena polymorpha]
MWLLEKIAPPPGGHIFQRNEAIFHEDQTINVDSSVLTKFYYSHIYNPNTILELVKDIIGKNLLTKFHDDQTINMATRLKNAPPAGSHVFQPTRTFSQLTHVLTKKNSLPPVLKRKNAPYPGSHVFQPFGTIKNLIQNIGVLTKQNAAFCRPYSIGTNLMKIEIPGGHVFKPTRTIF